jgi:hypothetical protein
MRKREEDVLSEVGGGDDSDLSVVDSTHHLEDGLCGRSVVSESSEGTP